VGGFCFAFALSGLGIIATATWTPVFLVRGLGAPAAEVGIHYGSAAAAGSLAGVCLAWIGSKLLAGRFGVLTPMRLYQASLIASLVPTVLLLGVRHPWQVYALIGIEIAVTMMGSGLAPTIWQDISPARLRGRVIAIAGVVVTLVQYSGPVLGGALSDALSGHSRGLLWAIVIVAGSSTAAAAVLLLINDRAFRQTMQSLS
jgi:hypothetical protein